MSQQDFLDSYAPIDGEVVTADPWPLPEPRAFTPSPTWRERLALWLITLKEKVVGVSHG